MVSGRSRKRPAAISRRRFLVGATAAATAPLFLPARCFSQQAPSERINVAFIGAGNQMMGVLLPAFLKLANAQVVAVCDVNRGSHGYKNEQDFYGREPAQQRINEHYAAAAGAGSYHGCDACVDYREVLARADVDAVVIAVPDHWHATIAIAAAAAGKDIYCEKPLSLTVADGRAIVEAVKRHDRILQTGSHERSNPVTRHACELVRNGRIGEVRKVTTLVGFHNKTGPGPGWQPMPVPEGFDYDRWLGPAPLAPYHQDRCLYRFRFNYDYSGGQVTNFGAHSNDMAQWALGLDNTGPVEVEFGSAKFLPAGSLFNAALETDYRCRFENGVELHCVTDKAQVGARFEGSEGVVEIGYGGFQTTPATLKDSHLSDDEIHLYRSDNHAQNFIECVQSHQPPAAPAEVGHRAATLCHLGVIACRLQKAGKVLQWDPAAERFANDDEANAMLSRPMREHPYA